MGYNNFGRGNIHPCEIQGDKFSWYDSLGVKHSYDCTLQFDVPKQCNIFFSIDIAFYLLLEDKVIIGRYDGVISVYKKCFDDKLMLVGIQHWSVPYKSRMEIAGYVPGDNETYPIYLDAENRQTLYCFYHNIEGTFPTPYDGDFLVDIDYIGALSKCKERVAVFNERGEHLAQVKWSVQDRLWRRDCEVFL